MQHSELGINLKMKSPAGIDIAGDKQQSKSQALSR